MAAERQGGFLAFDLPGQTLREQDVTIIITDGLQARRSPSSFEVPAAAAHDDIGDNS